MPVLTHPQPHCAAARRRRCDDRRDDRVVADRLTATVRPVTSVAIRPTQVAHRDAVLRIARAAFTSGDRDAHEEADIVVRTWELDVLPDGLDLVALDDDAIVGHWLAAVGDLDGNETLAVGTVSRSCPRATAKGSAAL